MGRAGSRLLPGGQRLARILWTVSAVLIAAGALPWIEPVNRLAILLLPALGLTFLGCLVYGSGSGGPPGETRPAAASTFLSPRTLAAATIAILLLATAMRLWKIHEWPPPGGIGFEEFQIGATGAMNAAPGLARKLLYLWANPDEHRLEYTAAALSIGVFGKSITAMRIPFFAMSLAGPFLFLLVCRELVSREVALFALLLYSVAWWLLTGGRVADEIFFPAVLQLLVFWLLIRFVRTAGLLPAFFLALVAGLFVYEYTAYHLVPFLVLGELLGIAALARWRRRRARPGPPSRRYGAGIAVFLLVAANVVMLQLYDEMVFRRTSFFFAGVGAHASDPGALLSPNDSGPRLSIAARLTGRLPELFIDADVSPWFAPATEMMFDPVTLFVILLSLGLVAVTVRRPHRALVLSWALIPVAGSALLAENLNAHRNYMAVPFFFVAVALGVDVLWNAVARPLPRRALVAVFLAAGLFAAVANAHQFLGTVLNTRKDPQPWRWTGAAVVEWALRQEPRAFIAVICEPGQDLYGDFYGLSHGGPFGWLTEGLNLRLWVSQRDALPAPPSTAEPFYYVVVSASGDPEAERLIHNRYSSAKDLGALAVRQTDGPVSVRLFRVPPA